VTLRVGKSRPLDGDQRKMRASHGFILPLTLWIIAALGLVAAVISEWVADGVENALAIRDRAEAELAFANVRNELVYMFARYPNSPRGLEVGVQAVASTGTSFNDVLNANFESSRFVALDGRPYVMESNSNYAVQIQDGRGLINLNIVNGPYLERLFMNLGINDDLHSLLIDTLLDYRDEDDFGRLSGAEEDEYARLGLYPPSNYHLLSPWEAQRVIGWTEADKLWQLQYERPLVTTCRSSGFNPNTAPAEALATYVDGVTIEQAPALIEFRNHMPFRSARGLGDAAGVILRNQPFFFSFVPGRCLVVDLIDRTTNERIRFSLTFLPRTREQPWQIDYVIRIPEKYRQSLAAVDPEVSFPSPEEVTRGVGRTDGATRF